MTLVFHPETKQVTPAHADLLLKVVSICISINGRSVAYK